MLDFVRGDLKNLQSRKWEKGANNIPGRVAIIFSFSGPVFSRKEQVPCIPLLRVSNPNGFLRAYTMP
jgi:hypothetical protein